MLSIRYQIKSIDFANESLRVFDFVKRLEGESKLEVDGCRLPVSTPRAFKVIVHLLRVSKAEAATDKQRSQSGVRAIER